MLTVGELTSQFDAALDEGSVVGADPAAERSHAEARARRDADVAIAYP